MTVPEQQAAPAAPTTRPDSRKATARINMTPTKGDRRRLDYRLGHLWRRRQWQRPIGDDSPGDDDINGVIEDLPTGATNKQRQAAMFVLDDGLKSELGLPKDLQHLIDIDRVVQRSGEEHKQLSSGSQQKEKEEEDNLLAVE